jgi:hypothetical protein
MRSGSLGGGTAIGVTAGHAFGENGKGTAVVTGIESCI